MEGNLSWPIWASASSDPSDTQEPKSSMPLAGPNPLPYVKPRREIYSKEQWLALKPFIQQLYIDEGQTFRKVAEYLHQHHDFNPTKKQFTRKISEWGLEKNIKQKERRAILQSLGAEANAVEFEARILRGRRLDKAKIERWRKREGIAGGNSQTVLAYHSGVSNGKLNLEGGPDLGMPNKDCPDHDDTVEDLQDHGEPANQQSRFNPWLVVDIVGSPSLTGLIGALTIDACEDIPSLDLSTNDATNSDEDGCRIVCPEAQVQNHHHHPPLKVTSRSDSFRMAAFCTSSSKQTQRWMPGPLDELYTFPKLAPARRLYRRPRNNHLVSSYSLKAKEFECRKKFKALKSMQPSEIDDLAEDMRSIAWRHDELDQYRPAEIWWRRVVASFLEIREHRAFEVLSACMSVVDSVLDQGRYIEAASLHQRVHHQITKLFGPEHDLVIMSRHSLAVLRGHSQDYESEAAIYRELLQTFLLRFGIRNRDTLNFLKGLGYALASCDKYREAEALLRITVQLDFELSSHTDRDMMTVRRAFDTMNTLAESLNNQGRYRDGINVLNCAAERFKHFTRVENHLCSFHFCEKARALRFEGCLFESEEILRAILRHAPDHKSNGIMITMEELADILMRTGRELEAVILQEKSFFAGVEMYGIKHSYSKSDCWQLGFTYTRLGRYDDAILLFKQTIKKVALSNQSGPDFPDEYIEELQGWIVEVEEIKEEAQNLEFQRMS